MLTKVKLALRLSGTALDGEVLGLIAAAKADLRLVGIIFDDPTAEGADIKPLIERAVILYCKAHFGFNHEAQRFEEAYLYQKRALALAGDFNALE
jgi:hypothetical protein